MKIQAEIEVSIKTLHKIDYFVITIHSKEIYVEVWGLTLDKAFEELNHYHGQKLFNACKEKQCSV